MAASQRHDLQTDLWCHWCSGSAPHRENPFGGDSHLSGATLLEAGTIVFTADDDHLLRHPDLPALTAADSPGLYAFLGGPSALCQAAEFARRDTPFPDTPELIRMQVRDIPNPKNSREAMASPYAHKWRAADRVEMDQMFDKGVLEPVNRACLLYTSPSPRDYAASRMPSSA